MIGFINCYKPKGVSSFWVVSKIKKIYGTKKVGHLGTLDPMAEGVLPIAVGKATRFFDYFLDKDKWYDAEFEAGYKTDTLDADGEKVVEDSRVPSLEEIKKTLPNFIGKIEQIPPKFSAKKINGERAYNLARAGKEFSVKPNQVEIYAILAGKGALDSLFRFKIHCRAGTYIRSLGCDIFDSIGYNATMTKLVRLASGSFEIGDALTIEEIENDPQSALSSIDKYLPNFSKLFVTSEQKTKLLNGVMVDFDGVVIDNWYLVYCDKNLLGAFFANENDKIKLKINLYDGED